MQRVLKVCSLGPVKTFCHHRLMLLEQKFNLHLMLNADKEFQAQKTAPHRDFYNVRKVRTDLFSCTGVLHTVLYFLLLYANLSFTIHVSLFYSSLLINNLIMNNVKNETRTFTTPLASTRSTFALSFMCPSLYPSVYHMSHSFFPPFLISHCSQ
jgi:hypothetical protein